MRIKIKEAKVSEDTNRKTGEVYRSQWAYFSVDGVEKPFKVSLGVSAAPFPPGEYSLSERSFRVTEYDKLTMRFPELVSAQVSAGK